MICGLAITFSYTKSHEVGTKYHKGKFFRTQRELKKGVEY